MKTRFSVQSIAVMMAAAVLLGCSTPMTLSLKKHAASPKVLDASKGYIFIYREADFTASARGIYISANGKRIGGLNNGTYFVYQSDPGEIVIAAENTFDESETARRKINVELNKSYYLKGSFKSGSWDVKPHMEIVHSAEGEQAIQSLSFETME